MSAILAVAFASPVKLHRMRHAERSAAKSKNRRLPSLSLLPLLWTLLSFSVSSRDQAARLLDCQFKW